MLDQANVDLNIGCVVITPLSWTDLYLVNSRLTVPPCLCLGSWAIKVQLPLEIYGSGFLNTLGEFLRSRAGNLANDLDSLWYDRVGQAFETIGLRCQCPVAGAHSASWFNAELRALM